MPELTESQRQNAKRAWHDAAMAKQNLVKILDPDEIITTIAPHVQYAPTEPGAPLSDKECNELNVSIYGGVSAGAIAVINRTLAKRNVRKAPAPFDFDGDLIQKALTAYNTYKSGESRTAYQKMNAAARLIADELLSPVTFNEAVKFGPGCQTEQERSFKVDAMLAARRARIEAIHKTDADKIADMLIAKGPDNPYAYRKVAAEIVEKLKADRTRVESK
jgi:hypothetical protein